MRILQLAALGCMWQWNGNAVYLLNRRDVKIPQESAKESIISVAVRTIFLTCACSAAAHGRDARGDKAHAIHVPTRQTTAVPTPISHTPLIYIYTCDLTQMHLQIYIHIYTHIYYIYIYICIDVRKVFNHRPVASMNQQQISCRRHMLTSLALSAPTLLLLLLSVTAWCGRRCGETLVQQLSILHS